ncbi:unconventional myosin-ie-like protein [Lasius niger]|uniref:Unconventional myosin-ie-like protein n=1 Tax=Lasius niger TaxID=67767 RepID=A0A0J7L8V0_LASNI|nr:unconventional myosin-ie-like protein [Lasius niger]
MDEEYVSENIRWTPIEYFNNAVVVELLEGKRPPGLFLVLDDVCATLHGGSTGADIDLKKKLAGAAKQHDHFQDISDGFAILHYAGAVSYSVDGFCDKNRDVLFLDLIELMQTSANTLVRELYPRDTGKTKTLKSRPTTAGSKIRSQASRLVGQLMKCTPHYIRCIKPNETKKPRDWDHLRVKHQVEYLGLKENIRVRRAGFAYRRTFAKFLHRYAILTKETWPRWPGEEKQGVEWILGSIHIDRSQYQLGRSKLFIKAPETLFMLEEARDRKYNMYARVIQKAFKKYFARKRQQQQKQEAANLLFGHKERRRASLNRNFVGDYIGLEGKPQTMSLLGRREKVFFAEVVKKYDRRFKDNFIIIHTREDYASLLESVFKTEFLSVLGKKYLEDIGHPLNVKFSNDLEFKVKKEGWGGGGTRHVRFTQTDYGDKEILKSFGKILSVSIGPGLPSTTTAQRSMTPTQATSNGRPNIPPNRPNVQPVQLHRDMRSGTNYAYPNMLRDKQTAVMGMFINPNPGPRGLLKFPPPPTEPPPPHEPARFKLPPLNGEHNASGHHNKGMQTSQEWNIKQTNDALDRVRRKEDNIAYAVANRKMPPQKPTPPSLPKVKALYDYEPQDLDELGLREGDILEVLKEHEGGWWHGRLKGKTGLFPSNYVEKI